MMAVSSKQLEPGTESAASTFQVNTWNSQKSWNSQKFARGRTKRSGGCLLEGAQTKREVRWLSAIKVPEQKSCQFEENAISSRKPVDLFSKEVWHSHDVFVFVCLCVCLFFMEGESGSVVLYFLQLD